MADLPRAAGTPHPGTPPVDARLVESEERYRAVIENASDMIQSCRVDGTFEYVNPAWIRRLGYTEEEVERLTVWDVIHPDSVEHCQQLFTRAVGGESITDVTAIFRAKDGSAVPVEGNATPRLVDGEVVATHSFFRDISERLRSRELEDRNTQLEREQRARYLEKLAALGKLSAGLAHELNNPAAAAQRAGAQMAESIGRRDAALRELHALSLSTEQWAGLDRFVASVAPPDDARTPLEVSRLEDAIEAWLTYRGVEDGWELAAALVPHGITPDQLDALEATLPTGALLPALTWAAESIASRQLAEVVNRSTRRISDLVSAVKAYSFMDRATEQQVDVHEGLDSTVLMLQHKLKHLTVRREYDRTLPTIRAVGSSLNQVWTNIIDNAADAVGPDGTITLRTRHDGECVIVEVEDDGPGIAEEHLSRVFEPFFSTKPQGAGTGLGLDTAWRIITEEHRGNLEVESRPGRTLFRATLPTSN